MNTININKIDNSYIFNKEWAKSVAKFDNGESCYFEILDGGEKFYFQYIKRDISLELNFLEKGKYFDIVTPFDYGAFYYTSEHILKKGLSELIEFFKKENVVSGFFRFLAIANQNYEIIGRYINIENIQEHIIIDLTIEFQNYFSRRKLRNIKKAIKYNYEFVKDDSLYGFYNVYIDSMRRVDSNQYFKFELNVLKELLKFGKIFSIYYGNRVVSSIFVIEDENEIYYFLGGTLEAYLKYGFNSLLFKLVSEYYKGSKRLFYLGGGQNGLYQYKREFSNKTVPFYIGKKIFNKDIYDKLLLQTNRKSNNFFPQYRKKII